MAGDRAVELPPNDAGGGSKSEKLRKLAAEVGGEGALPPSSPEAVGAVDGNASMELQRLAQRQVSTKHIRE